MTEGEQTTKQGDVPCAGCTACCRDGSMVVVKAEYGDDVASYKTQEVHGIVMLTQKINGECIYLGATGCTIHDRLPAVCRSFDCRVEFLSTTPLQRTYEIGMGHFSKAMFDAGEKRAHTLRRPFVGLSGAKRERQYAVMRELDRRANAELYAKKVKR